MKKRTKAFLLQAPAWIILIGSFIASLYVKISNTIEISWGAPVLLAIVIGLYVWGRAKEKQTEFVRYD